MYIDLIEEDHWNSDLLAKPLTKGKAQRKMTTAISTFTATDATTTQATADGDLATTPPPPTSPIIVPVISKNEASLAPFNPTCDQAQSTALRMLDLSANDVLFDLGCGDARLLLHAALQIPGLRCVGIELDRVFVDRGREALKKLPESVQTRVDIRQGDLLQLLQEHDGDDHGKLLQDPEFSKKRRNNNNGIEEKNGENESEDKVLGWDCQNLSLFRDATALYMFLLPKGIKMIQGLLDTLVERCRQERRPLHVVAHMFSVRKWEPAMVDKTTKGDAALYLYKFLPENYY